MADNELVSIDFHTTTRNHVAGDQAGFSPEVALEYVEKYKVATYHNKPKREQSEKKMTEPVIEKSAAEKQVTTERNKQQTGGHRK